METVFTGTCETFILYSIGYTTFSLVSPLISSNNTVLQWGYTTQGILVLLTILLQVVVACLQKKYRSLHYNISAAFVGALFTSCICLWVVMAYIFIPGGLSEDQLSQSYQNGTLTQVYIVSEKYRWQYAMQGSALVLTDTETNGIHLLDVVDINLGSAILCGFFGGFILMMLVLAFYTALLAVPDGVFAPLILDCRVLAITNTMVCIILPSSITNVSAQCGGIWSTSVFPMLYIIWICWDDVFWVALLQLFFPSDSVESVWHLVSLATQPLSQFIPTLYIVLFMSTGLVPSALVILSLSLGALGSITSCYAVFINPLSSDSINPPDKSEIQESESVRSQSVRSQSVRSQSGRDEPVGDEPGKKQTLDSLDFNKGMLARDTQLDRMFIFKNQ
jgi:glycerol uptake facilitator-like aquaporin